MVKVELNFEKKHLYLVAALVVFLVGIGVVVAYGGVNPNIHGHSVEELEGVQRRVQSLCGEGSFIRDIDESGATICDADTDTQRSLSSISGRVVGGAWFTMSPGMCDSWGDGNCRGAPCNDACWLGCDSGSLVDLKTGQKFSGEIGVNRGRDYSFVCVS